MRHWMVDPDNEERLLKVPPHVVARIKAEAYAQAVEAVRALPRPLRKTRIVVAIEGLSHGNRPTEPAQANSYPLSASADSSADAGERRHHGGK